jgi:5-formyltetrahydrofolate cyclo-ligase
MPNSKDILRQHFLRIRKSIPESESVIAAKQANDNFLKFINMKGIKTIAFYYPVNAEIDPMILLKSILFGHKDIICALPTVVAKDSHLIFHAWKFGDKVKSNVIYPQLLESLIQEETVIPDLIIVPLVAFDKKCHRIGYGAGFYDRTIAKLKKENIEKQSSLSLFSLPLTVGYAYEYQKVDSLLPIEQHDVQLDFIVTDKFVYAKEITN